MNEQINNLLHIKLISWPTKEKTQSEITLL